MISVKTPEEFRQQLQEWASANSTSMTAEWIRSVGEHARRKRREKTKAER
jgi:hypothetical protein